MELGHFGEIALDLRLGALRQAGIVLVVSLQLDDPLLDLVKPAVNQTLERTLFLTSGAQVANDAMVDRLQLVEGGVCGDHHVADGKALL